MNRIRLFALMAAMLFLAGCSDSAQVQFVKDNKMVLCPGATVGRMVDGFMNSPFWESGNDGTVDFVNVWGDITYGDKPVRAVIQFLVDLDAATFEYNAVAFDAVPQAPLIAAGLLTRMCESVQGLDLAG